MREKDQAHLHIKDARYMSANQRHRLAEWLRRHADDLERDGDNYAMNFTGHYRIARAAA